ncbi:uncharacterized protein IL334_006540 [Kwoniella shivajii]|uniref:Uncharacterized protein n=1 Tax=Kwoniella shivajii TaxID=564305 RepID=A0ABZ1D6X2_9TREE|nr:hypothetical protein IL334_006540 [Kwoniella shivajii]
MDLLSSSVDIAFLLLTLLVIYHHPISSSANPNFNSNSNQEVTVPPPNSHNHGLEPGSPHPSPGYLAVPSITVTRPSRPPLPGAGGAQGRHKKKSVSFSLSSMDDLIPSSSNNPSSSSSSSSWYKRRPPTPFQHKLPKSPIEQSLQSPSLSPSPCPSPARPPSPCLSPNARSQAQVVADLNVGPKGEIRHAELEHGILKQDHMSIQKKWLVT